MIAQQGDSIDQTSVRGHRRRATERRLGQHGQCAVEGYAIALLPSKTGLPAKRDSEINSAKARNTANNIQTLTNLTSSLEKFHRNAVNVGISPDVQGMTT
jgi:hypothetical protein